MKKVCVVIGTRPEAIKMAPVVLALREHPQDFDVSVCSTGQHTTMLDGAMSAFNLKADVELDVMKPGQSLAELTSRLLLALNTHFAATNPDLVLVHGDTTSAMTGALAAFYNLIEVAHVEAGLRTGNLLSPFPEEYNRRSVALAARYHFAPTVAANANLVREGIAAKDILVTGNTVIDALLLTIQSLEANPSEIQGLRDRLTPQIGFDIEKQPFILITAHRRENFGLGLDNICFSIRELATANPDLSFIYPVHLNPKVKDVVEEKLSSLENVNLIPPQDYKEFAWLLRHCHLVLTDSGGIQEEAPALGKPVLVMRDTSERPEAITAGTARLVGTSAETIIRETQKLIDDQAAYNQMARAVNPFGDGKAAIRIIECLKT
ncbi:MAG: UDP-N-acetylglucosamine 2-epimerase (non-hydrolyzing) [Rhodobacteraceae bacterium]|nr:UDP-N-acetylglucosamine 2-epimerase (non-hydrolyzing) [Paracoccaceae bacterium]